MPVDYDQLPQEKLEELARAGDKLAQARLDELACLRFEGANSDLPVVLEGGAWIRFRREDGKIHMSLDFMPGSKVTIEAVHQEWHVIAEWQRRLREYQGPWRRGGVGFLYSQLLARHDLGEKSYKALADRLNDSIAESLRGYLDDCQACTQALPTFERFLDFIMWQSSTGRACCGRDHAKALMGAMGIGEEDAEQWCNEMLASLSRGDPAFLPDGGPITRDHVRERVRSWKKRIEGTPAEDD